MGFAGLLYVKVRAAKWAEVDAILDANAAGLDTALRLFPPMELAHQDADDGPPPKMPPKWNAPPPKLAPRERLIETLDWPGAPGVQDRTGHYFVVWRADGSILKSVGYHGTPAMPHDTQPTATLRSTNGQRERYQRGPRQTTILVGMPLAALHRELRIFAWQLVLSGAIVLAIGLSGGWLISRSILRPIATIATTASRISGANLTERIDESEVDAELAGLARVLNATFDRLQAAFDRQTQFTADASHELRTPLAVLRSQAELTLSRPRTEAEYQLALNACLRAAIRMTELVEQLLLLARADSGMAVLPKGPVAWATVVSEVLEQLRPLATEKEVSLHVKLQEVVVLGDAVALAQVVTNLVTNAIQHNRPGGRVQIRLRSDGHDAELHIHDTGPGIAPKDQARLFERFYRVDHARARSSGGNGLGLAICLSIINAHDGEIGFESPPGEGTTFWVRLPCGASQN